MIFYLLGMVVIVWVGYNFGVGLLCDVCFVVGVGMVVVLGYVCVLVSLMLLLCE